MEYDGTVFTSSPLEYDGTVFTSSPLEYDGTVFTSSPLINRDELLSEWKTFRRALVQEKKSIMLRNPRPTLQDILQSMQEHEAYKNIFPQMFCLINVLLSIPMSTATVDRSFSQMKLVKNRLIDFLMFP